MASASTPTEFVTEKLLGEGAFGKVFLCHDKMDKSRKYAMKVIDLSKSPPEEQDATVREAKLLQQLKHVHIVTYVSSFKDRASLCIVTEYCDGGDLSEVLEQQRGRALAEDQIVNWFGQICRALKYLHIRNILHRDIKTQNIFLTGPKKDAKLGDLGLAKVLDRHSSKAVTMCGTPYYMSPEIFQFKPYDAKSDIWAMGVVVYEMTTLEKPFDAMLMQQLVHQIIHGQLPQMPTDKYSTQLSSLLETMLCKDPSTRPSADDILRNPLFITFKNNKGHDKKDMKYVHEKRDVKYDHDMRDVKYDQDKRNVKYYHGKRDLKYDQDGHVIIVSKEKDKFILRFDKTDIHIYKADVLKLRCIDVIAVNEDSEISGNGTLSRILLDAGGENYRAVHRNLRRYFDFKYPTGQVLMTTAGEHFSFHHVLHAVICRQAENTEHMFQKTLQQTFSKILDAANRLGSPYKEIRKRHGITLALPLLGTGTHKDKETILKWAWTAHEAISKFLLTTKEVNITEIHIIDNNEYVIQNVETAFVPSGSGRRTLHTPKPDFYKNPEEQYKAPKGKRISIWKMDTQSQKKADFSEFMKSPKQAKKCLVIYGDETPERDEKCGLCLLEFDDPVELTKCNHVFCKECITEVFRSKPSCPVCKIVYGIVFGDQPKEGKATVYEEEDPLPGYREKTYVIYYEFESGVQKGFHPKQKKTYDGIRRQAYLPKTREGTEVLELLERAFKQGLTFTIGTSRTTGKEAVITWNDIHHKTSRNGGPEKFGYPDLGYLSRVKEELACKGITSDSRQLLSSMHFRQKLW